MSARPEQADWDDLISPAYEIAFGAGLHIADVNQRGKNLLGISMGDGLNRLPVKGEDVSALQKQLETMLSDCNAPYTIFRVRSLTDGGFLMLHLRRTDSPDGEPLVVAVC